jgi:hypothetical protein
MNGNVLTFLFLIEIWSKGCIQVFLFVLYYNVVGNLDLEVWTLFLNNGGKYENKSTCCR